MKRGPKLCRVIATVKKEGKGGTDTGLERVLRKKPR